MKVLIITDERTGGTSFSRICGAIINKLCVDDINTHFDKFKNKDTESWAYNFDIENKIGMCSYFGQYNDFSEVDIYDMIKFLFENGIDIFKLSINDAFWTKEQTANLVNSLNTLENNFIILKLIRCNNFDKILSKCIAITLYGKMGDKAYDVKTEKYDVTVDEKLFKRICQLKMRTNDVINSIIVPESNIFTYESFYKDINDVNKLKKLLGTKKINNKDLFYENYYKDYKSENVTVTNVGELEQIFNEQYFH